MKHLVNKKDFFKTATFMGEEIQFRPVTVGLAKKIDALAKDITDENQADNLDVLKFIITETVVGAEDLTDEDFESFPITELVKLTEDIMDTQSGNV